MCLEFVFLAVRGLLRIATFLLQLELVRLLNRVQSAL